MADYRVNTRNDLPRIGEMLGLSTEQITDMRAVSAVLPFKVNDYVIEHLIDRDDITRDPIFQLTFPQRGMLEDTLVLWIGEFGRQPDTQILNGKLADGRDHNAKGYCAWLAGGGVREGISHGATDELGYEAVENQVHLYDLQATILHLVGLDHTKLTYRYSGRDFRLTDVHGQVVHDILT